MEISHGAIEYVNNRKKGPQQMNTEIEINAYHRFKRSYAGEQYKPLRVEAVTFNEPITVDFERSIEELTQNMIAPSFNKTGEKPNAFAVKHLKPEDAGISEFEMILIKFPFNEYREEIIKLVSLIDEKKPWRCAGAASVFTFASKCKEKEWGEFGVIGLGSVAKFQCQGISYWSPLLNIRKKGVEIREMQVGWRTDHLGIVECEIPGCWWYLIIRENK